MARAPMETIDELVDFLTEQHDQLESLLPQVLQAGGAERARLWRQVRQTLAVHEALEQETVHPAAGQLTDAAQTPRIEEEGEAEGAIAGLERVDPDSEEFAKGFDELQGDIVDHAEHEESEEFHQLSGELTPVARERVAVALELFARADEGTLDGATFEEMLAGAKERIRAAG
ncbi:MAG TPA: hemerythrin domain-containing protein [Marmoricola sp.]|nr:hemerythrin domain-containing protein [Marmoricola sp.]